FNSWKNGGSYKRLLLAITKNSAQLRNVTLKSINTKNHCFLCVGSTELHAHLSGSLSDRTLETLLKQRGACCPSKSQLIIKEGHSDTLEEVFMKFRKIHEVTGSADAVYKIACDVIQDFCQDNVKYLELRSTPREVASAGLTKRKYIETVLRAIEDQEKAYPDIIVKYLPSIDRRHTIDNIADTISLADELSKTSCGRIVGMDLSGDPLAGDARDLCPLLLDARRRGLKLAVHLGEIQNPEDSLELLKVIPDRVGHGTFLHPEMGGSQEMLELMLKHSLPLELCLSSNVKGQTVKGFDQHHFQYWFQHGHPVTFATDDKGVFSTSLSEEFHIAAQTFSLSKEQLWNISLQTVDYIFADEKTKEYLKEKWFSSKQKAELFSGDSYQIKY
ncbi:adenosine deaminase-like protein, partial [Liolophura sinensis]|uniref:adenosine deaminase-like protein n=1 Tax=Liolophura sinensis TaxID=3198878 RepID=UPI003158AA54